MSAKLIVSVINNSCGNVGRLTLNKPNALNALDIDMINRMLEQLIAWRSDDSIAAVFIDSELDKAFCAGGDIVSIYEAMSKSDGHQERHNNSFPVGFLSEFFSQEYRLDYCIHAYPKPVISWGHGIIMGGGVGIYSAASIKIVSENIRFAMPEITIGLFPDVGASYFLNKTPPGIARFLGLTGASINANDCINFGLANHLIFNDMKAEFLEALAKLGKITKSTIDDLCQNFSQNDTRKAPQASLQDASSALSVLDSTQNINEIKAHLETCAANYPDNKVLNRALKGLLTGSPLSAHLLLRSFEQGKRLSLAACFRMELSIAYKCCMSGEFQEGIRALLIDKDNQPAWKYTSFDAVEQSSIDAHFSMFDNIENPLHPLEQIFGEYHG